MTEMNDSFEKNGYYLFRNVFTSDEIIKFRKACEKLIEEPLNKELGDTSHIKGDVFNRSKVIKELFFTEKLINKIEQVLGENFHILPELSVMKSQFGRWHKDTTSIELFGHDFHKNEDFRIVNVAIYSQDNTEYGGGLDIVPGSHKGSDSYTEFYRKESEEYEKRKKENMVVPETSKPKKSAFSFLKRVIKFFLRRTPIIKKHFIPKNVFEHPLDSSDVKQDKLRIPTKVGDVVIFDLRLDHKASWPTIQIEDPNKHIKYAFFAICGRNNAETIRYREYLNERSEKQEAYAYLKNYQLSDHLIEMEKKFNITIS